jgi:hypothetical protein
MATARLTETSENVPQPARFIPKFGVKHRLRVSENRVLRGISEPTSDEVIEFRKLHNEKFPNS